MAKELKLEKEHIKRIKKALKKTRAFKVKLTP